MNYLNTDSAYILFQEAVSSEIYVDKSMLISGISDRIDIRGMCLELSAKKYDDISEMFKDSNESFVFLLDEWDSIFYKGFMTNDRRTAYCKAFKRL